MKKVLFTGGGSAGHVTVNLALMPRFLQEGWDVVYVGSEQGIERQLVEPTGVRYQAIATGKLRRYFDLKNLSDPFRVVKGVMQAYHIIRAERPNIVFSKGGFVSVPVVIGAWLNRVPVIIHESDITPGLANKISMRFAERICTTFPETLRHLPRDKGVHAGAVVRPELLRGSAQAGRDLCRFQPKKPILLVMGGSLGSRKINEQIRKALPRLTQTYDVVHLCGKGNVDEALESGSYRQFAYLQAELPDVLAAADVVVSRAGSNAIFELLALRKPMLLIPLSKAQSRGDQILNAQSFASSGFARVLEEEELSMQRLLDEINRTWLERETYIDRMNRAERVDAATLISSLIQELAKS